MRDGTPDTIASHAYYLAQDGTKVAAEVLSNQTQNGPLDLSFEIQSKQSLKGDAWYWLVIEQDSKVQVYGANNKSSNWSKPFFTGSAPMVSMVELAIGPKAGEPMRVDFSEPVDLRQIDATTFIAAPAGVGKCVMRGTDCLSPGDHFVSDGADVMTTEPMTGGEVELHLDGSVMGASRTVAEGAQVSGEPLTTPNGTSVLVSTIHAGDWVSCQSGAAVCWSAGRALP